MGEVDHIRSEASGWPHIYLKSYEITDFAETGFGLGQAEEFHVDKAAPDAEGLDRGAAHTAQGFRHFSRHMVKAQQDRPAMAVEAPTERRPCLKSSSEREQVSQKPVVGRVV